MKQLLSMKLTLDQDSSTMMVIPYSKNISWEQFHLGYSVAVLQEFMFTSPWSIVQILEWTNWSDQPS